MQTAQQCKATPAVAKFTGEACTSHTLSKHMQNEIKVAFSDDTPVNGERILIAG
jgi:hypothetical protein